MKAALFDADGVIQTTSTDFIPRLKSLLDERNSDADQFISEIFTAEYPCLAGDADFEEELAIVLRRWGIKAPVEEVLTIWDSIITLPGTVRLIEELQQQGVLCCLATNQQQNRAAYMKSTLGYNSLFDIQFYSCELGVMKPGIEYFQRILSEIGLPGPDVLFIDDRRQNVEAAESVGINGLVFDAAGKSDPCAVLAAEIEQRSILINSLSEQQGQS